MFKHVSSLAAMMLLAVGACAQTSANPPAPTPDNPAIIDVGEGGQCRNEDWQRYVGKPRQSVPEAPTGLIFRFLCKDCMATMDYRTDRVSFHYDDKDIITRASCG
ncbi:MULTISPECIES: hemolysin [unclassified Brevundimonas]|uniref:hemolysin n=1 Tax=unclassified Brevundimonas TaxID=2622653 RepID=UPI0025C4CEFA|nr:MULTISPECIES: hemolysin [unclassified Brevundimonas]